MSEGNTLSSEASEAYFHSVNVEKQIPKQSAKPEPIETLAETARRAAKLGISDLEHRSDLNIALHYRDALLAIRNGESPRLTDNELCRLRKQGFTALSYEYRGATRRKLSPKCLALLAELDLSTK